MNKLSTEEMDRLIQREIKKTEDLVAEYREMTRPIAPENAIGRLSRMDAINNKAVMDSALRQAEDKLEKLRYISTRTSAADFGICKKCGNPIPPKRILLMPHILYCVKCAR